MSFNLVNFKMHGLHGIPGWGILGVDVHDIFKWSRLEDTVLKKMFQVEFNIPCWTLEDNCISHVRVSTFASPQLYAVAVKDLIRKTDRNYKVKTRNSTVEYTIKRLDPGGRYHIVIQLGNMSKEASLKINTGKEYFLV